MRQPGVAFPKRPRPYGAAGPPYPKVPFYPLGALGWRMGDALYAIKADFCGLPEEATDWVVYTPCTAGAITAGRYPDWARIQRAAGLTHMVIGDLHPGAYPGYPYPCPDLTRNPAGIRSFLETMLNTPSADGLGFTPVLMLDGGAYDETTPRERVDEDWPVILQAMTEGGRDLRPYVIVVIGWELITASEWSSHDVSYALQWLHNHGFEHIAVHNSPGRTAISSNPVEDDDPWQGAEAESFQTHGGEHVRLLLFQIEPPNQGDNLQCDVIDDPDCPFNRWNDAVLRVGGGYHGWRKMHLCAFETVAYWAFRNACDEAWGHDVASRCREVADAPVTDDYTGGPVTISYGNGLPWPRE